MPASQPMSPLPEHSVCPAEHDPTHLPFVHVELTHSAGVPHWPVALHVCTALPVQRTLPGSQTPTQTEFTHA